MLRNCLALLLLAGNASFSLAQDAERPVVKLATVLAVVPGTTTKLLLRGHKFEDAKEVKCSDGKSTAKILGQGNADNLNMQEPDRIGDRKIEIELTVPSDAPVGELALVVVTGKGESQPYPLLVGGELPIVEDHEPNDGFRQAQAIAVPQIVHGSIHAERNVDVFAITGSAGQKLHCEVLAARRGSNLDAILSLYNGRGELVASSDDAAQSLDAVLEAALPANGNYYLVLQDAHDLGGQAHPYRLIVK